MHKLGLIGIPLSHSFSPAYFAEKFKAAGLENEFSYRAYPLPSLENLSELLREVSGLNVTIPYKTDVIKYTDRLDASAVEAGAVNTLCLEIGNWVGYNTDLEAAKTQIQLCFPHQLPEKALILGTGGSAKAVAAALKRLNIPFLLVSRSAQAGKLTYSDLSPGFFRTFPLIINCTPAGMFPNTGEQPPVPRECWHESQTLFDLIYNPAETLLMQSAAAAGTKTVNGAQMLKLQAEASWKIWQKAIYG